MELTRCALAMLRAVADGRGEVTCSCEPDLYVDGVSVCDQFTAHALCSGNLIRPATLSGSIGTRVRAELSSAGRSVLETAR